VTFIKQLPKTATGKIQKCVLRARQPALAVQPVSTVGVDDSANYLAQVICLFAAVFYAGAISAPLVIRKTLTLGTARTSYARSTDTARRRR